MVPVIVTVPVFSTGIADRQENLIENHNKQPNLLYLPRLFTKNHKEVSSVNRGNWHEIGGKGEGEPA